MPVDSNELNATVLGLHCPTEADAGRGDSSQEGAGARPLGQVSLFLQTDQYVLGLAYPWGAAL